MTLSILVFTIMSSSVIATVGENPNELYEKMSDRECHVEFDKQSNTDLIEITKQRRYRPENRLSEIRYAELADRNTNIVNTSLNSESEEQELNVNPIVHKRKFDIEKAVEGFMSEDSEQGNMDKCCTKSDKKILEAPAKKSTHGNTIRNDVEKETKSNYHNLQSCNYSVITIENVISERRKNISIKKFSPAYNRCFFERKELTEKLLDERIIVKIVAP